VYILRNAFMNIGRNGGRSILIGAILLAVVAVSSSALAISRAAGRVIDECRNKYGAIISISPDIDKLMQTNKNTESAQPGKSITYVAGITADQYRAYAQSDYLSGYALVAAVPVAGSQVKAVGGGKNGIVVEDGTMERSVAAPVPALSIIGNSDTANLDDFKRGLRKITDGRMYRDDNECAISSDLASLNGLHVGDVINVNAVNSQQASFRLTITGIYSGAALPANGNAQIQSSYPDRSNEILTNFETAEGSGDSGATIQAAYYLKNASLLGAFTAELRKKGLPDAYQVGADTAGFTRATGALASLRFLALAALSAAFVLSAVALALLVSSGLKKRRHEIAALRLMGMKKGSVARGLLTETLLIASVSLLLGLAIGTLAAQPVAGAALARRADAVQYTQSPDIGYRSGVMLTRRAGQPDITNILMRDSQADVIRDIEVKPDIAAALQTALMALALAGVSALATVRFLSRNGPMMILTQRI
jgi:putative ABC transport system permease protein